MSKRECDPDLPPVGCCSETPTSSIVCLCIRPSRSVVRGGTVAQASICWTLYSRRLVKFHELLLRLTPFLLLSITSNNKTQYLLSANFYLLIFLLTMGYRLSTESALMPPIRQRLFKFAARRVSFSFLWRNN